MAPSECRQVYRRHGESGAAGTVAASAAVDLRHQTLAGGCEAAALAECGSTTGQRSWPGAEGVQCGCAFNPVPHSGTALPGSEGMRSRREGKRGYRRTGTPFIKALQACQTNASLKRRGFPRLQVATYRWIRKPGLPRPPCSRPSAGLRISGSGSGM